MTPDTKPSTAKDFSTKFSQRIKNAKDIHIQTQWYQVVQPSHGHDQTREECYDTR
jgi:hypothetical protein